MAKQYRIDIVLNVAQMEAASRKAAAGLARVDQAASRMATNATKAADRTADAQIRASERATIAMARANEKTARDFDMRAERATRAADRQADSQVRAAEKSALAERKASERASIAADRRAERAARAADRQADMAVKSAEKSAIAEAKAAEKAARDYDRRAERATRADDRKVDMAARNADRQAANQVRAAERAAKAEDRLRKKSLTDEEVALKVKNQIVENANEKKINAAMKAAKVDRKSIADQISGINKTALAIEGIKIAWDLAKQALNTYWDASVAQSEKGQERAKTFIEQRDELGELASIRDVQLTNEFVKEFQGFNVATGMKSAESQKFQTEFYNSAAQHMGPGKHISTDQGEIFKKYAAQFAVANKIEPSVVGDLGGMTLSANDYSKDGDNAAAKALGDLNQVYQIAKRGRGANPVLLAQFSKSVSTMIQEDRAQGVMSSPAQVMTGISVMAERNPEDAETYLRRAAEGLRDFDNPLIKQAKIASKDDLFESARKLKPVVDAEAKRRGLKRQDVLNSAFETRQAQGIGTLMTKGIEGGVIADREAYAAKFAGPEPARNMLAQYQTQAASHARVEAANRQAVEGEKGEKLSDLEVIRQQAQTELIRRNEIGTREVAMQQYAVGVVSAGQIDRGNQTIIDEEVARIMNQRAPGVLAKPTRDAERQGHGLGTLKMIASIANIAANPVAQAASVLSPGLTSILARPPMNPVDREKVFQEGIARTRQRGIDPLQDVRGMNPVAPPPLGQEGPGVGGVGGQPLNLNDQALREGQEKLREATENLARILQAQARAGGPPGRPTPVVMGGAGPNRAMLPARPH